MNKENTEKLFNDFPKLFPPESRKTLTASLMGFGFECCDGWFDLIYKLCQDIQNTIDSDKDEYQPEVLQVKEKFGGLRFYIDSGSSEVHKLINSAEAKSYDICEYCGSEDEVTQTTGWIKTICKKCINVTEYGIKNL